MTKYFYILVLLSLFTSCKVNRAYLPGQEGIETVYKTKQWRAETDFVANVNQTQAFHGSVSHSPINHVGILYDLQSSFSNKYLQNTIGVGLYTSKYRKYELSNPSVTKSAIDVGQHFDIYAGFNYGFVQNAIIAPSNINFFSPAQYNYEVSMWSKKYFVQAGAHFQSKYFYTNIILRNVWLDIDKIKTVGLNPDNDIHPELYYADKSISGMTELSIRVNFLSHYKPFSIGFTRRMYHSDENNFTKSAFGESSVFLGLNIDIVHLFAKKASPREIIDYKYEE